MNEIANLVEKIVKITNSADSLQTTATHFAARSNTYASISFQQVHAIRHEESGLACEELWMPVCAI